MKAVFLRTMYLSAGAGNIVYCVVAMVSSHKNDLLTLITENSTSQNSLSAVRQCWVSASIINHWYYRILTAAGGGGSSHAYTASDESSTNSDFKKVCANLQSALQSQKISHVSNVNAEGGEREGNGFVRITFVSAN